MSADFRLRPVVAILGQDKDGAGINGAKARPSPTVPAHTAPGSLAGTQQEGATSPRDDKAHPKTRLWYDHSLGNP